MQLIDEGELEEKATIKDFLQVQIKGDRKVKRKHTKSHKRK